MKKLIVIFTLIALVTISGCSQDYIAVLPLDPLTLQDVLTISQQRREGIIKPSIEYASQFIQQREERTINPARFVSTRRNPQTVTYQEAIEDFNMFADALRQLYTGYTYFGGDEVFLPIFEQVRNSLASQEIWLVNDFMKYIFDALNPVINDGHFYLANHSGSNQWHVSFDNQYDFLIPINFSDIFDKSENGFRNRSTGHYIQELLMEGLPLDFETENIFRLSLSEDGAFYYSIVIKNVRDSTSTNNSKTVTIVYDNGRSDNITVSPIPEPEIPYEAVSLQHIQGLPIATIRSMYNPPSPENLLHYYSANKFLELAEDLRNESVVIVDVRSNMGGDHFLPMMWLHTFTGEIIPTNFIGIRHLGLGSAGDLFGYWNHLYEYDAPLPIDELHRFVFTQEDRIIPNNQLLIILTDRYTASAAEFLTDMAFNLENTLVIGQNTWGLLKAGGNGHRFILPNSTGVFFFGQELLIHPPGHLPEGVGMDPDLWVNGNALEATIAMLIANEYYINKLFR